MIAETSIEREVINFRPWLKLLSKTFKGKGCSNKQSCSNIAMHFEVLKPLINESALVNQMQ